MPIRAMGRFNHEAVAVDPNTNIIYQTEDEHDSLIYRYIPENPEDVEVGGNCRHCRLSECRVSILVTGIPKWST
ncbi:MAG: DUF839 domain-containing protein [Bacteroidetes bacterium]|nr:DUF839 domain-containing protein [Bacteroidota bacterium]